MQTLAPCGETRHMTPEAPAADSISGSRSRGWPCVTLLRTSVAPGRVVVP